MHVSLGFPFLSSGSALRVRWLGSALGVRWLGSALGVRWLGSTLGVRWLTQFFYLVTAVIVLQGATVQDLMRAVEKETARRCVRAGRTSHLSW